MSPSIQTVPSRPRCVRFPFVFAASVVLVMTIALFPSSSFANSVDTQTYLGKAYGTYVTIGSTVVVDQTAPVSLGGTCGTSQQPLHLSATAAGVNLPPIVSGGVANTNVSSSSQYGAGRFRHGQHQPGRRSDLRPGNQGRQHHHHEQRRHLQREFGRLQL